MKTIADKCIVIGSDISGYSLKEAIKKHLTDLGWTVEDVGVTDPYAPNPEMFHRVFKVGAKISEKEYERGICICGTGMGIHIAANKCPGVQAAVVESVRSAKRASQANNTNVLAMGGFWMSPADGIEAVDEWLNTGQRLRAHTPQRCGVPRRLCEGEHTRLSDHQQARESVTVIIITEKACHPRDRLLICFCVIVTRTGCL